MCCCVSSWSRKGLGTTCRVVVMAQSCLEVEGTRKLQGFSCFNQPVLSTDPASLQVRKCKTWAIWTGHKAGGWELRESSRPTLSLASGPVWALLILTQNISTPSQFTLIVSVEYGSQCMDSQHEEAYNNSIIMYLSVKGAQQAVGLPAMVSLPYLVGFFVVYE